MLEALQSILPALEASAKQYDDDYRQAWEALKAQERAVTALRDKSAAADSILRLAREFVDGTYQEVPL